MSAMICSLLFLCFFLQANAFLKEKSRREVRTGLLVSSLLNLGLLIIFAAGVQKLADKSTTSAIENVVLGIPKIYIFLYIAMASVVAGKVYYRQICRSKTEITNNTIREAADTLPMGLCFYDTNGQIQLINKRMNQLGHKLRGKAIVNGEDFWEFLEEGSLVPGCKRLSRKSPMIFQMADQTVWQFDRKEIYVRKKKMIQVTASERTMLYQLLKRQEEENEELKSVNKRLEVYAQRVEELTRARQRLDTKVRIHDTFGQILMETRYFLSSKTVKDKTDELLKKWHHIISLLQQETKEEQEDALYYLKNAAASAGIKLKVTGKIPDDRSIQELFLAAGAEALTNAVRHGKADNLWIETGTEKGEIYFICSNDGVIPQKKITEGGGLSTLRQKTELAGGSMKITAENVFSLKIRLPKAGEGRENDTCIDCGRRSNGKKIV